MMSVSDFVQWFYPTLHQWLEGGAVYSEGFFNPPWALWFLLPLNGLSREGAFLLWALCSIIVLIAALFVVSRHHDRRPHPLLILLFLLTPAGFVHLTMGQLSMLLLLGIALLTVESNAVNGVGLALLSIKPHIGLPFVVLTNPRSWLLPAGVAAISFLLRPRWPLNWLEATTAAPPASFSYLISMRSLLLGWPFLIALAVGAFAVAAGAYLQYRPGRTWALALVCCAALVASPYTRLYDNVLLFYPATLVLNTNRRAWPAIAGIFALPLIWVIAPWAVFVDWLAPLAMLAVVALTVRYQDRISGDVTSELGVLQ